MPEQKTDEQKYFLLEEFINQQEDKSTALISTLHYAQELFDYLPTEVQLFVSRKLGISAAKVYGVVSFYSFFTTKPRGKYKINVCLGTACFVKGSEKLFDELKKQLGIAEGEVTSDGLFSLHPVRCIGCCGLAPAVMINGEVFGRLTIADIPRIINTYRDMEV